MIYGNNRIKRATKNISTDPIINRGEKAITISPTKIRIPTIKMANVIIFLSSFLTLAHTAM